MDGTEKEVAVAVVKKCLHAIVMNSICLQCFAVMQITHL